MRTSIRFQHRDVVKFDARDRLWFFLDGSLEICHYGSDIEIQARFGDSRASVGIPLRDSHHLVVDTQNRGGEWED